MHTTIWLVRMWAEGSSSMCSMWCASCRAVSCEICAISLFILLICIYVPHCYVSLVKNKQNMQYTLSSIVISIVQLHACCSIIFYCHNSEKEQLLLYLYICELSQNTLMCVKISDCDVCLEIRDVFIWTIVVILCVQILIRSNVVLIVGLLCPL